LVHESEWQYRLEQDQEALEGQGSRQEQGSLKRERRLCWEGLEMASETEVHKVKWCLCPWFTLYSQISVLIRH